MTAVYRVYGVHNRSQLSWDLDTDVYGTYIEALCIMSAELLVFNILRSTFTHLIWRTGYIFRGYDIDNIQDQASRAG